MRALEKPAPWRLKPWSGWAFSARIAFLVVALAAVVVGFAEFRAVEPSLVAEASRHLSPVAAGCASFWNVLRALAGALALGAEHLGKGFMLACLVAVIGASAVCAGFGAIFVRLAWSGQGKNQL